MSTEINLENLIKLRKLTQIVSEQLNNKLRQHLKTLKPLFNPTLIFGEHIRGQNKATVATARTNFNELKTLYRSLIHSKPFLQLTEVGDQLDVFSTSVEIDLFKYQYLAKTTGQEKAITITSPMKWVLLYKNLGIDVLNNLVGGQKIAGGVDLKECVLHYLVLHSIVRKSGLKSLLEDLQFPSSSAELPQFNKLPITYLSCPISTKLPSDDILIDTTDISGTSAFEEVIDIDSIIGMKEPFKNHILEIVKNYDQTLLADT